MAKGKREEAGAQQAPWYRTRRGIYVVLCAVCFVVLVQALLWAGLSYKSVTGEDLTIFLEPETEYLSIQQGEQEEMNFTLGVNNLAFCTAACVWNVTAGETLVDEGVLTVPRGEHIALGYTVAAPETGTGTKVYQIQVACRNPPAQYCQSSGKLRHAAAGTVVNISYSEEKQEAATALQEVLPQWRANATQTASALRGIAALDDPRVRPIGQSAADEAAAWERHAEGIATALAAEEFATALSLLKQPPPQLSLRAYEGFAQLEQQAASLYEEVRQRQELLDTLLSVANSTDYARLVRAAQTARALHDTFAQQPPSVSADAFQRFITLTDGLRQSYTNTTAAAARQATMLLSEEQRMGCVLKNATCAPLQLPANLTLHTAVAALDDRCAELAALPILFDEQHAGYAAQLESSLTVAEVEQEHGVAGVRAESSFPLLEEQLSAAARNGTLLTENETLRLAVRLQPSERTVAFLAACTFRNESFLLPRTALTPTLPASPAADASLPTLALPEPRCCSLGVCAACSGQQRYPVVFVHGHSFTDASAPEYSLNAFTSFAHALQADGYLYAGHIFPRDDLGDVPAGELQQLPSGLAFTATYYYDSYPEEGETRFIVQKSENLETYAIRLKEDIDLVKHKTGQEKVVLVAHSMGGLVSRRYVQLFGEEDVAALIMIGTPNFGISNATQDLCPVFGGDKECADMAAGSVFLAKLNAGRQPSIPVHVFAGVGCSGRAFDGVVEADAVRLPFANNTVVEGSCPSRADLLHSALLDPQEYPAVYAGVRALLDSYTRP